MKIKSLFGFLLLLMMLIAPISAYAEEVKPIPSMNTKKSDETPYQINITFSLPWGFNANGHVIIVNSETGTQYEFFNYADNDWYDYGYVEPGTYAFLTIETYGDYEALFDISQTIEINENTINDVVIRPKNYDEIAEKIIMYYAKIEADANASEVRSYNIGTDTKAAEEQEQLEVVAPTETPKEENKEITASFLGENEDDISIKVVITKGGILTEAMCKYSLDDGKTWSEEKIIPLNAKINIKSTDITCKFEVPKGIEFKEGQEFNYFKLSPYKVIYKKFNKDNKNNLIVEPINDGDQIYTLLSEKNARIDIKITKAGKLGDAVYQVSFDGSNYSEEKYLENNEFVFEDLGVKVTLPNGYYQEGTYSIYTEYTKEEENDPMMAIIILISLVVGVIVFIRKKMLDKIPKDSEYRINM